MGPFIEGPIVDNNPLPVACKTPAVGLYCLLTTVNVARNLLFEKNSSTCKPTLSIVTQMYCHCHTHITACVLCECVYAIKTAIELATHSNN
jgi:hypothetical protein